MSPTPQDNQLSPLHRHHTPEASSPPSNHSPPSSLPVNAHPCYKHTIVIIPKSFRTHELMVTTACSGNIPVSGDLSTESRYRRCHLVNLCEHCNRWEPSLYT